MKEKCCLCGRTIEGYAHNAQPLADGKCCEECKVKVEEARLEEFARFLEVEEDELCPNQKKMSLFSYNMCLGSCDLPSLAKNDFPHKAVSRSIR